MISITVLWWMAAGACVALALIHLSISASGHGRTAQLLFALLALAVACMAAFEVTMMRAQTIAEFAATQRWAHAVLFVIVVSIVGLVRAYTGAGRRWLGCTVAGLALLALVVNFCIGANLEFREITALNQVRLWNGETVTVATGLFNPWSRIGQLALQLLVVYVADATLAAWRRGDREARRRALRMGGGLAFGVLAAAIHHGLVLAHVVSPPYFIAPGFVVAILAMGYELGTSVGRADRLEQTVVEIEGRFRATADAAPVMIWMAGTDKLCTYFNRAWTIFTGRSIEQELGNGWTDGVHRADLERCCRTYYIAFDARQEFEMEYRLRRHDGEYRWIRDNGSPRFAPDGTFAGYIGSCFDITDFKHAEERMRQVVEALPSALAMVDQAGVIALVNEKAEAVFGYARTEMIGRPLAMLIPASLYPAYEVQRTAPASGGATRTTDGRREVVGQRKDGSNVPLEVGLSPVRTGYGTFALVSIIDTTERRQVEMEMASQRSELAHLSRVNLMGELSGSLAHELNQPLTAILSNAQAALRFLAQDPGNVTELREILDDIVEDDKRAGEVIRHLRMLLKKGEPHHESLDLNEVVQDVVRLMRSDLVNRDVTVDVDLASDLPAVSGDRIQLQQVLLNLIVNGCDAMDGDTARRAYLEVQTMQSSDGRVVVAVIDRGKGVAAAELERIFEPFFTTKAHGMGLGLAVCRTIVTSHGGRLWAANNADYGTTFRFALPATRSASPP